MSHTITAKLNEDARIFQAGESTGFGFRLGERYYDRETQKSEYTNYEGAIFSKNDKQIEFLTSALVKGAILTVSCDQLKIDSFTADNGTTYLKNQMQNCRMDNVFSSDAPQQQPAPTPQPKPQPQRFGANADGGFATPSDDLWVGAIPAGEPAAKGATIEQIKNHEQVNGDFNKAVSLGWVTDSGDVPF